MSLLAERVDASQRVAATSARLAKVRALAECLRALAPDEVAIAVAYLAGEVPQGRIGLGWAQLRDASENTTAASEATLGVAEVDERLTALAAIRGSGSAARRGAALRELFARATAGEREFLLHLLAGELRQGALGGVMLDAIAAAAALPAASVRRAAMYAPSLGAVARAALAGGEAGLPASSSSSCGRSRRCSRRRRRTTRHALGARRAARLRVEDGRRAHPAASAAARCASFRAARTR
jgi:DNA ligase-1